MKTNQPLVSILMNCYNGEHYLAEALNSIMAQSYKNYEIIFIDNCSTDNSEKIVRSYPIHYIKTEKNIPLGAARNFGLTQCKGLYVAFLDTDDVWMPNALEHLVTAICSGDYALAYGGQIDINSQGTAIKKYVPRKDNGNLFQKLLYQFDIPFVGSLISMKWLSARKLSFDSSIYASTDYCLFMQLAVDTAFVSLDVIVVKYRVHGDSLTVKTIDKWAHERRYTLNKIIQEHEGIELKFKKAFQEAYARAAYYEMQYHMSETNPHAARKGMKHHLFTHWRYFALYLLTFLPCFCWDRVQNKKYHRGVL